MNDRERLGIMGLTAALVLGATFGVMGTYALTPKHKDYSMETSACIRNGGLVSIMPGSGGRDRFACIRSRIQSGPPRAPSTPRIEPNRLKM